MNTQKPDETLTELELLKLRFDFAWKHFDFHAKQRTTMFQYFVTIMPFILGGYFFFFKEKPVAMLAWALIAIAALGFILSLAFWMFDVRNQQLYKVSQENLRLLEATALYKTPLENFKGIVTEQAALYDNKCRYKLTTFRLWMFVIYALSMLLFFFLGFYAYAAHRGWYGWTLGSSIDVFV